MKKLVISSLIIGVVCLAVSPAEAVDIRPPDWRGLPGSTLQDWDYLTEDNPLGPDGDYGDQNPYGSPLCGIIVSEGGFWQFESSSLRDGMWAGVLNADFCLPNSPDPTLEKWVRVQVMYREVGPHPAPSSVTMTIGNDVFEGTLTETVTLWAHGYGWKVDVWDIVGTPNPALEYIDITFPGTVGGLLDHVVIDTICIPEPTTMVLLGIGGLVMLRRKRS